MSCRLGLESFQRGYLIPSPPNRWCIATQKRIAPILWSCFLQLKLHCLTGQSIWWQMLLSVNSSTKWMLAMLPWFLRPTWHRLANIISKGVFFCCFVLVSLKQFNQAHYLVELPYVLIIFVRVIINIHSLSLPFHYYLYHIFNFFFLPVRPFYMLFMLVDI